MENEAERRILKARSMKEASIILRELFPGRQNVPLSELTMKAADHIIRLMPSSQDENVHMDYAIKEYYRREK